MFNEKLTYRLFDNMEDSESVAEYKAMVRSMAEEYNELLKVYKTLAMAVNAGRY